VIGKRKLILRIQKFYTPKHFVVFLKGKLSFCIRCNIRFIVNGPTFHTPLSHYRVEIFQRAFAINNLINFNTDKNRVYWQKLGWILQLPVNSHINVNILDVKHREFLQPLVDHVSCRTQPDRINSCIVISKKKCLFQSL